MPTSSLTPVSTTGMVVHRILLGAMVVFAYLSVFVPPLKLVGTLSVRALALLDLITLGTGNTENATKTARWIEKLFLAMKAAAVIIGALGIILALVPLSIAAFSVDIVVQIKGFVKSIQEGRPFMALAHIGFLIIDALALAAIVTGGWQLAVAAASLGATMMMTISIVTVVKAFMARKAGEIVGGLFEGICYGLLAGLGIEIAHRCSEIVDKKPTAKFVAKNRDEEKPMVVTDNKGHVIAEVAPGKTQPIEIPRENANTILLDRQVDTKCGWVDRYDPYLDEYYTTLGCWDVVTDTYSPPFVATNMGQLFGENAVHTTLLQAGNIDSFPLNPLHAAIPVTEGLEKQETPECAGGARSARGYSGSKIK